MALHGCVRGTPAHAPFLLLPRRQGQGALARRGLPGLRRGIAQAGPAWQGADQAVHRGPRIAHGEARHEDRRRDRSGRHH